MIPLLRTLFICILASMLWVTSWASLQCPLFGVPHAVATHPWFIATLFDTYWAFVTFWVWVCFKQQSWLARSAWLIAILTLGNIAISLYCLSELFSLPANARASDVLTLRRQGPGFLGIVLAAAGIGVTVAAALHR